MGIVDRRWAMTPRDPEAPAWETVVDKEDRDLRMAVYAASSAATAAGTLPR